MWHYYLYFTEMETQKVLEPAQSHTAAKCQHTILNLLPRFYFGPFLRLGMALVWERLQMSEEAT